MKFNILADMNSNILNVKTLFGKISRVYCQPIL